MPPVKVLSVTDKLAPTVTSCVTVNIPVILVFPRTSNVTLGTEEPIPTLVIL